MVINYEGEAIEFKDNLPLLPVRDLVVYPFMILPLFVGREASIKAVEESLNNTNRLIMLSSQKDITVETPTPAEIYELGTVAMIMRMRKLPDGRIKILIQGLTKARIKEFVSTEPFYKVKAEKVELPQTSSNTPMIEALVRNVKENLEKVISLGKNLSPDILMVLEDIQDAGRLSDLIASNLNLKVSEAQKVLEILDPTERLEKINQILINEVEILIQHTKIKNTNKDQHLKNSKDDYLKDQIKAIRHELNEENTEKYDEFTELRDKITKKKLPVEAEKESLKQLSRLERMHPDSSEASILRGYLDWIIDIPWSEEKTEVTDLNYAKNILDEDHFDLEKVKERILEYLAVRSLKVGLPKVRYFVFQDLQELEKLRWGNR